MNIIRYDIFMKAFHHFFCAVLVTFSLGVNAQQDVAIQTTPARVKEALKNNFSVDQITVDSALKIAQDVLPRTAVEWSYFWPFGGVTLTAERFLEETLTSGLRDLDYLESNNTKFKINARIELLDHSTFGTETTTRIAYKVDGLGISKEFLIQSSFQVGFFEILDGQKRNMFVRRKGIEKNVEKFIADLSNDGADSIFEAVTRENKSPVLQSVEIAIVNELMPELRTNSRGFSIEVNATNPDTDGEFIINIQTSVDTASLKIDDEEQGPNKVGAYAIRRLARVGVANVITVTAKDVNGNTATKSVSVTRQAVDSRPTFARLNPLNVKPRPARDAVAIIIGIQNYKLIPKAEYASQDAQYFYDYASRALGIKQENIKLMLDDEADVSGILTAFQEWLPLKVRKGNTDVYVFYSGHGLPSADGKSLYFLPVGANKNLVAKTAISQREIVDALRATQPKSVTMFLDSCYSGQIRTGETLLASARPVVMKVDEIAYPPEFTVITASASDQIASSSPDLKHGIFSYYLMKGLEGEADENKDGTITIGKLQSYLAERVPRFAMTMSRKQEPQLVGDSNRVLVGR